MRAAELRRIEEVIREEMIRRSIRDGRKSTIKIPEDEEVPEPSRWDFFHRLYLAPLVVEILAGVLVALVLYWLGVN